MAKALAATRKWLDAKPDEPLSLATANELREMFDEADALHAKRQTVGRFPGLFAHHSDEPAMPIYPAVAEDIGKLVAISQAAFGIIERGRDQQTTQRRG